MPERTRAIFISLSIYSYFCLYVESPSSWDKTRARWKITIWGRRNTNLYADIDIYSISVRSPPAGRRIWKKHRQVPGWIVRRLLGMPEYSETHLLSLVSTVGARSVENCYRKDEDCEGEHTTTGLFVRWHLRAASLQDIIRFLQNDSNERQVFLQLTAWNVLAKDLIPLLNTYYEDAGLSFLLGELMCSSCLSAISHVSVKLFVFLTLPPEKESRTFPEQTRALSSTLRVILDHAYIFPKIMLVLAHALEKMEARNTALEGNDLKMLQLVFTFFRNLLLIASSICATDSRNLYSRVRKQSGIVLFDLLRGADWTLCNYAWSQLLGASGYRPTGDEFLFSRRSIVKLWAGYQKTAFQRWDLSVGRNIRTASERRWYWTFKRWKHFYSGGRCCRNQDIPVKKNKIWSSTRGKFSQLNIIYLSDALRVFPGSVERTCDDSTLRLQKFAEEIAKDQVFLGMTLITLLRQSS